MPPEPSAPRPNILLIVSDQHRYDCLGRSDAYPVATPNLDALADGGSWFSSAYTPIPLCTPARQALLTGRRPEATGGLWNYDLGPRISSLDPDAYAWPRELQRAGYATSYVGKWHVNPDHGPGDFGYDEYVSLEDYDDWRRQRHPGVEYDDGWFGQIDPLPVEDARTHWLADRTSDFVARSAAGGRAWHARLDFLEPHLPCRPTREFAERYHAASVPRWAGFDDPLENKPYIQRQQLLNWRVEDYTWEDWAPIVARYYAAITQMDDAIGRVLRTLDEAGQADNTIVVYTSDHGDMCGSHRMMDKHYVMYDDVVRVPFIVRWPERLAAGRTHDDFVVNALDLAPTLAAAAGVVGPPDAHGSALFTDAGEVTDAVAAREEVVSTYNGQQFGLYTQRMIRTRAWKYVWNATDVDELYDLRADPAEIVNRIDDSELVDVVADLRRRLRATLVSQADTVVDNAWMADQFASGRKLGGRR